MDNEKIAQVAKALWDDDQKFKSKYGFSNEIMFGGQFRGKAIPWEYLLSKEVIDEVSKEWRDKAVIAIKAMREPTEKMIDAGSGIPNYDDVDVGDSLAKDIYQAMIDAVIND